VEVNLPIPDDKAEDVINRLKKLLDTEQSWQRKLPDRQSQSKRQACEDGDGQEVDRQVYKETRVYQATSRNRRLSENSGLLTDTG